MASAFLYRPACFWAAVVFGLAGAACSTGSDSRSVGASRDTSTTGAVHRSGSESDRASSGPREQRASSRSPEPPPGVVYVPAGSTRIGVETARWEDLRQSRPPGPRPFFGGNAHPPFWTYVDAFFLDKHPVTVAQFRGFVEETGYTTDAVTFGDAGVLRGGTWHLVDGAFWRAPRGPEHGTASDDHPVTQVSWRDAKRYCEWAGKRLPTEVEWEHAARDGRNNRSICPWDGSCREQSTRTAHANTWQGRYPVENTVVDGYRFTSPVGAFGANDLGLQDMSGNVWEWTASWMRPYDERGRTTRTSERVLRGGSFICHECGGYFVFSRSSATPETALFNVGFRCARDPSAS